MIVMPCWRSIDSNSNAAVMFLADTGRFVNREKLDVVMRTSDARACMSTQTTAAFFPPLNVLQILRIKPHRLSSRGSVGDIRAK